MFRQIDFSHERDLTIDELCRRVEAYYPDADFTLIKKSYNFAEKAHKGQMRSSGEEYIIHPLNVASTLAKLRMDVQSIIAGLLHDVVEDCDVNPEQVEKEFGKGIALIVVGLTKISKIKFKTREESQAENFRKMVVAMAQDLRVIIVKLADRMHNMRTLQYVSEEKQKKIAQETLDIYVPLASRLGINSVKTELEDLCMRFLHPDIYYRMAEKIAMKRFERETYIKETISTIHDRLLEYALNAEVKGRSKHFFSIYKKMKNRGVEFDQIHDMLAFRLIVNNITECYKTLGIIHSSFTPIPGRFKDYIAIPKVNNYQSLHTTVIGPMAERIEIQIRTNEMDEVAERGIAAHWKYKEGTNSAGNKLDWIQELLEFNQNAQSNSDLMDVVKNDLDLGGVFVFTPNGDVRELRHGATPLDFAYAVHTEVGNKCVGAKINGKIVPLRYALKSGDTVEVLTSKTQTPSKDWLKIVRSSKAKAKIRQWLMRVERERNVNLGKELLEKSLKIFGTNIKSIKKNGDLKKALEKIKVKAEDELYNFIGAGKYTAEQIVSYIPSLEKEMKEEKTYEKIEEIKKFSQKLTHSARKKSNKENAVIVNGLEDLMVRMARCCNPIPGDSIVGYVTRGRGITIHRGDCIRYDSTEEARMVDVEWNNEFEFKHPVSIHVITLDRPGILSSISKNINNIGVNIRSALARSMPDRKGSFFFEIEVNDYSELLKTIGAIESIEEVISVNRA